VFITKSTLITYSAIHLIAVKLDLLLDLFKAHKDLDYSGYVPQSIIQWLVAQPDNIAIMGGT